MDKMLMWKTNMNICVKYDNRLLVWMIEEQYWREEDLSDAYYSTISDAYYSTRNSTAIYIEITQKEIEKALKRFDFSYEGLYIVFDSIPFSASALLGKIGKEQKTFQVVVL